MSPKISVIIPSYNAARFVAEAVASALGQTLPPLEVIVVDDGSTDETEAVLRSFGERIRHIRQPNGGPAVARNRGIRESRGELIAFLDADDVWLPEKLEKQWRCLQNHQAAGLVHSNLLVWDDETGETTPGDDGRRERSGACYGKLFTRSGVTPSTVLLKRECLDRVGVFDETIREASTEDYDLFLRIARRYEFAFVDEPLILYRRHAASASHGRLKMMTNELRVVRKALGADPELPRLVGRRKVRERLHHLAFSIGYMHHDAGRSAEAREHFKMALANQPWRAYTLALYAINLLPPSWAGAMRRLKGGLSQRLRATPSAAGARPCR